MSDSWFRICPTDLEWQPCAAGATAAAAWVESLFTGPGAAFDEIEVSTYVATTMIDGGENLQAVTCHVCAADIDLGWFLDVVEQRFVTGSTDLRVVTPCCGRAISLDRLRYDWPIAFARFEIAVRNPIRPDAHELDDAELAEVGRLVGHPVVQVLAHH